MTDFQLIAHRGWSGCRPENTLAAFDAAVGGGWTNIETDVQLSSDLVPLVRFLFDEETPPPARHPAGASGVECASS